MDSSWIASDVRAVEGKEPLARVLGWLRGESDARPIVTEDGHPKGIVNTRALTGRGIDEERQVRKVMFPVPVLSPADDLTQVARRFSETLAPYLPVANGKDIAGCLPAAAGLVAFGDGPRAEQCMAPVPTLSPSDTMEHALKAFGTTYLDQLPVLDERGRIRGALRRQRAMRVHEFGRRHIGRMDRQGFREDNREDPIEGWMDGGWTELPRRATYEDLVEALQRDGYTFLVEDGGRYVGTVGAPHVWRVVERHPMGVAWVRGR